MEIGGISFVFTTCPSDCEDSLIIWLPNEKVCINNHTWPTMPNIYTLRGKIYRDPRVWISGLDQIRSYEPEHLVTCHGIPLSGRQKIHEAIENQRDALQFIFDQAVRYMNKGYDVNEIIQRVKLPEHLVSGPLTHPIYGEVNHYIRGVYRGLIGWFETNTVDLNPVTKEFEAKKIVEGFGGRETILQQARESLSDTQYVWAAKLASYLILLDYEDTEAKQLKADALRKLGQLATATTTRNFYLVQARELEGKLEKSNENPFGKNKLLVVPGKTLMKLLRVSIIPEKTLDIQAKINITFTDKEESYGFIIRNGAGEDTTVLENPDIEIQAVHSNFIDIISGEVTIEEALEKKLIHFKGDQTFFFKIFDALEI